MNVSLRRLVSAVALICLSSTPVFAQGSSTKATLTGVVTDSTGGVVPGATVVVKNVATGVTNETVTNSSGTFSVPALDAGTYDATISLSGFKTVKIEKIALTPGNTSSVSAKLDVGQSAETINVVAHTELVDTISTTVSATITADQINKLPLVTKNAMQFVTLLPGINSATGSHQQRSSTAMGLPQSAIAIVLDGVNVQDQSVKSTDGFYADIRPQTDLVEQVTVSEATATADSSGQGSVQIKFITRSGTNVSTGSAYEYFRDPVLNSNSWANQSRGLPKNDINWNQFGFRQGGPVVIPGLYDGHGKAFYFVNHEEFRLPAVQTTTRTVLSQVAQGGVFRYGCSTSGCTGAVNVLALAAQNGQLATVDPTIAQMFARINTAVLQPGSVQQNIDLNTYSYTWQPHLFRAEHLPGGSFDYNLNNGQRIRVTQAYQKVNSDPDIINNGYSSFPGFDVDSTQYSFRYTGTASLRSVVTRNLINEAGWGTIWSPVYFSSNLSADAFFSGRDFGFLAVGGSTPTGFNVRNGSTSRNGSNYNFHDTLSWLKNSHSLSMGGSFTKVTDWEASHSIVPTVTLGLDTNNDPAAGLFAAANFPGSVSADLTSARNLYAMLTGRITSVNGNAVLQSNGAYQYRGDSYEKFAQRDWGFFVQDQWRMRRNVTLNAGLRYELQYPIQPAFALYARNDVADLCGRAGLGDAAANAPLATIGCRFGVPGVALTSAAPNYKQYSAGASGYQLDTNNFAPSIGVAWLPSVEHGVLRAILGDPQFSTLRLSWGRSFNQPGISDFFGTLRNGPGLTVSAARNVANANLVTTADAATYGGNGWPVLLRQDARLNGPGACTGTQLVGCIPTSVNYPQPIVFNTGIAAFDPHYQTPYVDSWSAGIQRSLGKDTSLEVRYIANEAHALSGNVNYNEIDIYNTAYGSSTSFIDEFQKAQRNLAANIAAGRGATFAFTGAAGTAPLPIFLASYTGQGAANASDPTKYTGTQWTNAATLPFLSQLTPSITANNSFASTNTTNGLFANSTFRANGQTAGLPANFWVLNPDVASATLRTAEGFTKYHSVQILVNRRLSGGLAVGANYAYQVQFGSQLDTLFRDRALLRSTNSPPHAFKLTANYEIPVGHGKRFGSNINRALDGIIGNWHLNVTGRVETGRLFDIGDVKLVNMSIDDLQKMYRYYKNPVDGFVYMLPQDVIANTIKAFAIDATSPTGHPVCSGSNATTCGGPDASKAYVAPASDVRCTAIVSGDCSQRQQFLKAPVFSRIDMSAKKRFPFAKGASFEMEVDVLNVVNAIDFTSIWTTSTNPDNYRITGAYADINNTYDPGGRIGQLVFRLNW
jgi:hypothetical protein